MKYYAFELITEKLQLEPYLTFIPQLRMFILLNSDVFVSNWCQSDEIIIKTKFHRPRAKQKLKKVFHTSVFKRM